MRTPSSSETTGMCLCCFVGWMSMGRVHRLIPDKGSSWASWGNSPLSPADILLPGFDPYDQTSSLSSFCSSSKDITTSFHQGYFIAVSGCVPCSAFSKAAAHTQQRFRGSDFCSFSPAGVRPAYWHQTSWGRRRTWESTSGFSLLLSCSCQQQMFPHT